MGFSWSLRIFAPLVIAAAWLAQPSVMGSDAVKDSPVEHAMFLAGKARRAAKTGSYTEAYLLYSEAAALQPQNRKYRSAMESMQARGASSSRPILAGGSDPLDLPPALPDPFDSITQREFAQARQMLPPPRLAAKPGLEDFDLNLEPRALFTAVAQRFGLDSVFDGDLQPGGQPVRFRLQQVDYREALDGASAATNMFVTPVSTRVFMVAQDTPQKRNDLEQYIAIAIPVPQAIATQELTELVQVIRQATNVEKIAANTGHSEIVIRDRISRALPAEALLRQFLAYRPDVMIDLDFLSVSDSDIRSYGFDITNQFQAVYLGKLLADVVRTPAGVSSLVTFGGGRTLFGLSVAQVSAVFTQSLSRAQSLYHAELRSASGQPATLHVGDKYPVLTSGYFGASPTNAGANTFAPIPSFTYENLGLDMKLTPHIHGMDDVGLTLETSFELLTGQAVNGIPIFGNRKVQSEIRLRNGEWAVIAGLIGDTNARSTSGFAGLANIPLIGRLFRRTNTDREKSTVLIGIRPRLLSIPPSETDALALRVGSDTRPYIPK